MLLRTPPIEIDSSDPFEQDALERKQSAEVLTDLLGTYRESFVLSIVSPWGTGKTTFLEMWMEHLRQSGFSVIDVNAWESDISGDPLITLLGELGEQVLQLKLDVGDRERLNTSVNQLMKIGAQVLRRAIPVGMKLATRGVIDLDELSEEALADVAEKLTQDAIDEVGKTKETIVRFRRQLEELAGEIGNLDEIPYRPLIVVIDELDRCRPTYAVEFLEVAKHLFNANGVIFVVAIDKEQIEQSVKVLYGQDMKIDGYLRRFIDLEYLLPKPNKGAYSSVLLDRIGLRGYLMSRQVNYAQQDAEYLETIMSELFHVFDLSLRAQDQLAARLSIALRTIPAHAQFDSDILMFLLCLRSYSYNLYSSFLQSTITVEALLDILRNELGVAGREFVDSVLAAPLEGQLIYARGEQGGKFDIEKYEVIQTGRQLSDVNRGKAEIIIKVVNELRSRRLRHGSSYLAEIGRQIEISTRFSTS